MTRLDHPNEPGKWTRLASVESAALWRRERSDPFPVVQFYVLSPPRQTEVLYDEARARTAYDALGLDARSGRFAQTTQVNSGSTGTSPCP